MNRKYILLISFLFVVVADILWGFYASKDVSHINTGTTALSGSQISSTSIHSGKTVDGWSGVLSPFKTGSTTTNTSSIANQKVTIVVPNPKWTTRTMSGVTYVFGQGNPKEVALTQDELEKAHKKCGSIEDPDNTGYLCKENDGYMDPEVEKYLSLAFSDPNWKDLLGECRGNLSAYEDSLENPSSSFSNTNQILTYNIVANTNFLDINNWIMIDSASGRKLLDTARLSVLSQWILHGTNAWWSNTEYPVDKSGKKMVFANPTCVDVYGKEIYRNLQLAYQYYRLPQ